jgi:excisionase family DNA binding protein
MEAMSESPLLRAKEVAERLSISRAQAYRLMASGTIPSIRLGKLIRCRPETLQEWLVEQENRNGHNDR